MVVVLNHFCEQTTEERTVTTSEVKNFMKEQPNKQPKYQKYNSCWLAYAAEKFQTDISDMHKFKQEEEERYA